MFYIKENEQIVLADEVKQNIINSLEFMPQYKEFPILETDVNEVIVDFQLMTIEEAKAKEEQSKKERIAKLHLTGADVERALIKALNVDFEDIVAMVQAKKPEQVKMLRAELKANYFYRGNPYVEVLGTMLGLTKEQLDKFFETNDYTDLMPKPEELPSEDTENQPVAVPNEDTTNKPDTVPDEKATKDKQDK